jgi:hypothetical protein
LYGNPIFHAHTKACWCWLALCSWLSGQKKDSDSFHIYIRPYFSLCLSLSLSL